MEIKSVKPFFDTDELSKAKERDDNMLLSLDLRLTILLSIAAENFNLYSQPASDKIQTSMT